MNKTRFFPISLLAAAMLAGCSTLPQQNSSLTEAHNQFNSARTNPQVSTLAPLELQRAGETLKKADTALSKGESDATVNQLAYVAKQQVAIAQETSRRKAAELAIANASVQRDQVRLAARTAEADAAKRQVAISQAEVDAARRQAEIAQQNADQQAAALATASSQAQRDEAHIAARRAEADEARRQAEIARQNADRQASALAAAGAQSERDRALIAKQEQQLKELDARQTDRGQVITLGDVLFAVNKAQLSSGGSRNVQKLATFLNQYPQRMVLIEGHTDSTGGQSLNQALSERRSDAVRTALVDMGVDGGRIDTRGYAEAFPVASNETTAGRQLNRRVEIILSDENGTIVPR